MKEMFDSKGVPMIENYLEAREIALRFLNIKYTLKEYVRLHDFGVFDGLGMPPDPVEFYQIKWFTFIGKIPIIKDFMEARKLAIPLLNEILTRPEYERLFELGVFYGTGLPQSPVDTYHMSWDKFIGNPPRIPMIQDYLEARAIALVYLKDKPTHTEYSRLHALKVFKGMGMPSNPADYYHLEDWYAFIGIVKTPIIKSYLKARKVALKALKGDISKSEYRRLYVLGVLEDLGLPRDPVNYYNLDTWGDFTGVKKVPIIKDPSEARTVALALMGDNINPKEYKRLNDIGSLKEVGLPYNLVQQYNMSFYIFMGTQKAI